MSRSTLAKDFWYTLFGNRDSEQLEHELEAYDEQSIADRRDGKKFKQSSLYVRVFEDMVNVVLGNEEHLLDDEEMRAIKAYRGLEYQARYIMVRLIFRQPEWHSLSSLQKYASEIGKEGFQEAFNALCVPLKDMKQLPVPPTPHIKEEDDTGIVDLTFSDEKPQTGVRPMRPKPLFTKLCTKAPEPVEEPIVDPSNLKFDYLFRDQSSMSVEEALHRLTVPDLREIMRLMKVGCPLARKGAIIKAMITHAAGQHTLPSLTKGKGKSKKPPAWDGMTQTQLSFGQRPKVISQLRRLREMALERLGPCVKINPNLHWFIGRLHVICYRGTEKPTKYCLPALLAGFKKWNFPDYHYERDASIWPTRKDLLEFEEALHLDAELETPPEDISRENTVAPPNNKLKTPVPPGQVRVTPLTAPRTGKSSSKEEKELGVKKEEEEYHPSADEHAEEPGEVKESASIRRAKHIKMLYKERIEAKWKMLVDKKSHEKGKAPERTPGLERFEPGHVYTRMAAKAANAFGILKEYETELNILEDLLQQTHWRKGKRASWYERRALIQERYIKPLDLNVVKSGILWALEDEYVGIVNRPSLVRRLQRIEKKMKLHPEKRTICEGILKDPEEILIRARRSDLRPGMKLGQGLLSGAGKENISLLVSDYFPAKLLEELPEKDPEKDPEKGPADANVTVVHLETQAKWTGKSSWVGMGDEAVNVETYALQHYEMSGYVGFHSETRILTTIFALLFWDIIFSRVRGAFETPFQAGPLDMFEDSFYLARQARFESRLQEIKQGKAKEYIKRHYERYQPKQTWCIGLRWDVCEQEQLLEIVECLGPGTLTMISQLFCEDYAGRSSGVPDLIIWKAKEGICKFVEVKGPGDSPQPNQRLWFDSLLRAGANVEICRVIDQDAPEREKRKRKTPVPKKKQGKRKEAKDSDQEQTEEPQNSDDDADYLPQLPNPKRRKLDLECSEELLQPTPTSTILNGSPSARRPQDGRELVGGSRALVGGTKTAITLPP